MTGRPLVVPLVVLVSLAAAPVACGQAVQYDLRSLDITVNLPQARWQVTGARVDVGTIQLDLKGESPEGRRSGSFGVSSDTKLVTIQDGDAGWPLLQLTGLVANESMRASGVSVKLEFAAPPFVFAGCILELHSVAGDVERVQVSLPGSVEARRTLEFGDTAYKAERWQEAADYFRSTLKHRPNCSQAWRGLGRSLVRLRQNEEATVALKHAISRDPGSAYDQALLGFAILDVSTAPTAAAAALEHLLIAQQLGYDWEELRYFIGYAHQLSGNVRLARTAYTEYLSVGGSPSHLAEARQFLADNPEPLAPPVAPRVAPRIADDPDRARDPAVEDDQPAVAEPAVAAPAMEQPAIDDPAIDEPAFEDPVSEDPVGDPTDTEEPVAEPAQTPEPARPANLEDHVEFPVSAVADFGSGKATLEKLYVGRSTWILRARMESENIPGTGTVLESNLGVAQPLIDAATSWNITDLTFGVPSGQVRTVTLRLHDPVTGVDGDSTFEVPGYDEYRAALLRGHRALGDERYAEAITAYDDALLYRAGDADAWWRRGICHQRQGNLDGALGDLRLAAALKPDSPDIQALFGNLLLARGDAAEAVAALEHARDHGAADSPATLLDLGDAYTAAGKTASARETYQAIIDRFPVGTVADQARKRLAEKE